MKVGTPRRHWIVVATVTVNFVVLGGVTSIVGSQPAVAAPAHRPVAPPNLNTQPTGAAATTAQSKCAVTVRSTPFTINKTGWEPLGRLIQIGDSFYGATDGAFNSETFLNDSAGTIFKLTDEGKLTALQTFSKILQPGFFGEAVYAAYPNTGLVKADDGNFYGSLVKQTLTPGVGFGFVGYDSLFRLTPDGEMTTIYTFPTGAVTDLVEGPGGALYGTTYRSVFKITTKGKLTTLHVFGDATGSGPDGPLLVGHDGVLYGMTNYGPGSNGTVFRITPDGRYRTLYAFNGTVQPYGYPVGGLVQDEHGNLYGETQGGINDDNLESPGFVFKLTPQGLLTTLYSFSLYIHPLDGTFPSGGLTWGRDGNLYGVTLYGGTFDWGTLFRLTPKGLLTTIYNFTEGADGAAPMTGLTLGSNGDFYGTTSTGGSVGGSGVGTAFRFEPPSAECAEK
jgi:uncharacterized repeat protein (TIGR03803 family)